MISMRDNALNQHFKIESWRMELARRLIHLEKLDGEPLIRSEEEDSVQHNKTDPLAQNSKSIE